MHACMGMKVEEWEDGQVNIGIAVCPERKGARIVVPSRTSEGQNTPSSLSTANTPNSIVPKTAFVIRPPENYQSQGGINITYAHHESGKSDLIIMLSPESQGQPDKISFIQQQIQQQYFSPDLEIEKGIKINHGKEKMEENQVDRKDESATNKVKGAQELVPVLFDTDTGEVKGSNFPDPSGDHHQKGRKEGEEEEENLGSNNISRETSCNHKSPQEVLNNVEEREMVEEKEGSPNEEFISHKKSGGSVKRVSWVEDCEKFVDEHDPSRSCNNSKENKRESVRKSNGMGNNGNGSSGSSNRNSPMKKHQNGYNLPADDAASVEGYTMAAAGGGKRNSGDKSRIPVIATNGDYQPTCDYYRRKMLRECSCYNNPPTLADNWYGYTSLQRYAGQKVVKKITAEQKRLEEDISNRRKTEIWILGNDMDDYLVSSPAVPLRKKTTRLKPMQIVQ